MKVPLRIPPGVARGSTPGEIPGRWYDTNLVRWNGGLLRPLGGWERITSSPLPDPVRVLHGYYDNTQIRRLGVGTDNKLYVVTTDSTFDATPTGFVGADSGGTAGGYGSGAYGAEDYGDARELVTAPATLTRPFTFSLDNFGQDLLALASSDGKLYRWTPTAPTTIAAVIATAPTGNRAMWVTPERHVVLGGHNGDGRSIAWSSREDYSDWDFASTTNTAGAFTLDSRGLFLAHVEVREGTLILTDADAHLMRYVGQPFVYGFDPLGETSLICPTAISAFEGGRAAWIGRSGFHIYENGAIRALPSEVSAFVLGDMDPIESRRQTVACANGVYPEVWWFYPSNGAVEPDRYVIWNYAEGWWALGQLGRTAGIPSVAFDNPIMAGTDGHLYQHEAGWTDAGLTRIPDVYAESTAIRIGAGERVMAVTQVMPDAKEGLDSISFRFFTRLTPDGAETERGPYTPRSDGYMDVRFSARDVRVRVEATADGDWGVGVPLAEIGQRGKR
jgi:hypothetical protein